MSQREKLNQGFLIVSDEFNAIESLLTKNVEIGQNLGQSAIKVTPLRIPQNPEDTIPGSPGTLFDCVTTLHNSLTGLQNVYQKYSNDIEVTSLTNFRAVKEEREQMKQMIDSTLNTSETFDKHLVTRTVNEQKAMMDSLAKVNEYIDKNIGNGKAKSASMSAKSKFSSLWQTFVANQGKFLAERQSLKISASDLENKMASNVALLEDSEQTFKASIFENVLKPLVETTKDISSGIHNSKVELEQAMNWLNFNADFGRFSQTHKVNYFDISFPRFERFKFTSQFTQPDQFYIPRFKLSYFPLLAAVALSDFTPDSQNEIPLVKGKRVYLMEAHNQNWVLAMNAGWCQIGFIPSSYVKVVGSQLAYARAGIVAKCPNIALANARLLAIIDMKEKPKKAFLCEDEDGKQFQINAEENLLLLL